MRLIDADKLISALQSTQIEKHTITDLCNAIEDSAVESDSMMEEATSPPKMLPNKIDDLDEDGE